jgi:hypothetical protein
LLRGEFGEILGFFEPLQDLVGDPFETSFDTAEDFEKDPIIGIELSLRLDQTSPTEVVEPLEAGAMQALLHGVQKPLPFLQGNRNAFFAKAVE